MSNSSWSAEKYARKWSQVVLPCADLMTPAKVKVTDSGIQWQKSMVLRRQAGVKDLVENFVCNVQR